MTEQIRALAGVEDVLLKEKPAVKKGEPRETSSGPFCSSPAATPIRTYAGITTDHGI